MNILMVGLGGALGAILRYSISLIPVKMHFPFLTFLTNIIGAFVIGLVVGIASRRENISDNTVLFLKTGLCGGFTTFSTFSLETLTLFQHNSYALGVIYAVLSCTFCVAGVALGQFFANKIYV